METDEHIAGLGGIFAILAKVSKRPRYAFLVLQLVTEAADEEGRAGPYVHLSQSPTTLRDWLCRQLLPLSDQGGKRAALRHRVEASLRHALTGNAMVDRELTDQAVEEQILSVGRANVSRAISDLVRAGLVTRYYSGYATNHHNRGGGRHAVYVVSHHVLSLLRRPAHAPQNRDKLTRSQGDLFAA
jgi:hypothetical protein